MEEVKEIGEDGCVRVDEYVVGGEGIGGGDEEEIGVVGGVEGAKEASVANSFLKDS